MRHPNEFIQRMNDLYMRDPINGALHYVAGCLVHVAQTHHGNDIYLTEFRALEPAQGDGTAALHALCDLADTCKVTLVLIPKPLGDDGPGKRKLVQWYRRFGFRRRLRSPEMYRLPNRHRFVGGVP